MGGCPVCHYPRNGSSSICSQCGHRYKDQLNQNQSNRQEGSGESFNINEGVGIDSSPAFSREIAARSEEREHSPIYGRVQLREERPAEDPPFDPWMGVFYLFLAVNIIAAFVATFVAGILVLFLLVVLPALIFRRPLNMPSPFGCLTALFPLYSFMSPNNRQRNQEPVAVYLVTAKDPDTYYSFRVKGNLNHPIPVGKDVRVWGPVRNDVVEFQRGELEVSERPSQWIRLALNPRQNAMGAVIGLAVVDILLYIAFFLQ